MAHEPIGQHDELEADRPSASLDVPIDDTPQGIIVPSSLVPATHLNGKSFGSTRAYADGKIQVLGGPRDSPG